MPPKGTTPEGRLAARKVGYAETAVKNACWRRFGGVQYTTFARLQALQDKTGLSMDGLLRKLVTMGERYGV